MGRIPYNPQQKRAQGQVGSVSVQNFNKQNIAIEAQGNRNLAAGLGAGAGAVGDIAVHLKREQAEADEQAFLTRVQVLKDDYIEREKGVQNPQDLAKLNEEYHKEVGNMISGKDEDGVPYLRWSDSKDKLGQLFENRRLSDKEQLVGRMRDLNLKNTQRREQLAITDAYDRGDINKHDAIWDQRIARAGDDEGSIATLQAEKAASKRVFYQKKANRELSYLSNQVTDGVDSGQLLTGVKDFKASLRDNDNYTKEERAAYRKQADQIASDLIVHQANQDRLQKIEFRQKDEDYLLAQQQLIQQGQKLAYNDINNADISPQLKTSLLAKYNSEQKSYKYIEYVQAGKFDEVDLSKAKQELSLNDYSKVVTASLKAKASKELHAEKQRVDQAIYKASTKTFTNLYKKPTDDWTEQDLVTIHTMKSSDNKREKAIGSTLDFVYKHRTKMAKELGKDGKNSAKMKAADNLYDLALEKVKGQLNDDGQYKFSNGFFSGNSVINQNSYERFIQDLNDDFLDDWEKLGPEKAEEKWRKRFEQFEKADNKAVFMQDFLIVQPVR